MLHILNGKEMHACDEKLIFEKKVSSLALMEKASLCVFDYMKSICTKKDLIGILCGPGNNGGDGLAVARMLSDEGYQVLVYLCCEVDKFSKDEKVQYDSAVAYEVSFADSLEDLKPCDYLIDGIFGTGLCRNIEGKYKDIITAVNEFPGKKIAIDIPSGVFSDDGRVLGCALKCDATITFAFYKKGQLLYPGKDYCGETVLCNIGISQNILEEKMGDLAFEKDDFMHFYPKRNGDSHKGSYGKVLVIAGSKDMAGAAYFCSKACYLMGVGLVKIFTHQSNKSALCSRLPEAILSTYENRLEEEALIRDLEWADLVVMGPGMSTEPIADKILKCVFDHVSVPMVIDADGLNLLAKHKNLLKRPHLEIVLTPHLGEMSRLVDEPVSYIKENLLSVAEEFSRDYNVVVTLKDATTIVARPYLQSFLNMTGNSGMATAGSGDVLTGITAGLMALGIHGEDAAPMAVYFHGLCGDYASREKGQASMMASDLLEGIPFILNSFVL